MDFDGAGRLQAALADMGVTGLRLGRLPVMTDGYMVEIVIPRPYALRKAEREAAEYEAWCASLPDGVTAEEQDEINERAEMAWDAWRNQ